MTDRPPKQSAGDDGPTGKFDVAFDATVPAATTTGPVVQTMPRRDVVPLELQLRFQNIERIGAGGMGVVYRAFDSRLGREVALKLLRDADPKARSGFLVEAKSQARVEHDNICRVYDVGESDGEPFIVMQFINGESLSTARRKMSRLQLVGIMERVSSAVQTAHARGLVHRDIKPGNILVETRENGTSRPYVVDFGISHDIERSSDSRGWMGTPAYMAPEMVIHREKHLADPRADIYGLGATLFDVLADRAPYVGQDAWHILEQITNNDPPKLRSIVKDVPVELEAIVAKCLQRDPARRYATAQALADDLQRFLDGEPIAAPQVGIASVTRRMFRKHARKAIVAVAAVVVAASLTGIAVVQRNAAKQADLAQDIGRTVTEMELYMRTAYQMPPHDIERERPVVRDRIKALEGRLSDSDHRMDSAAQYALGRAYLALGDEEKACEYLLRAESAGYTSPELNYAIAIAQLGTFANRKDQSEWYTADEQQKKSEIEALKTLYFDAALARLRVAEPARIEHPAYAAAIVAYHEGRYPDAVQQAHEAFEHAPLLFEAKQLEADALFEIASQHWWSGKPDWWEQMSAGMEKTLETYAVAENIARSNPRLLRSICGARTRFMYAAFSARSALNPVHDYYEAAKKSCNLAVDVDPSSTESQTSRANMHSLYALTIARADSPDDPLPAIQEAVRVGEEASRLAKGSLVAYQTLGNALRAQAGALLARGQNASDVLTRAEHHYDEARRTFTREASLRDARIYVATLRGIDDQWRGVDMKPRVIWADALINDSLAAKQLVTNGLNKRGTLHIQLAEQLMERGRSPVKAFATALDALIKAKESNPPNTIAEKKLRIYLGRGRYAHALGRSARNPIGLAVEELKALGVEEPDSAVLDEVTGLHALLEAEERIRTGADPQTFLLAAREAFRSARERAPQKVELFIGAARVEMVAAQRAVAQDKATADTFSAIRAPLQTWITDRLVHPDAFAILADSYRLEAEWRQAHKESPETQIIAGLAMVDRAIATNPKHAHALATRGRLWLCRALSTKDDATRTDASKKAVAAFEAAFQANPLLEQQHRDAFAKAQHP